MKNRTVPFFTPFFINNFRHFLSYVIHCITQREKRHACHTTRQRNRGGSDLLANTRGSNRSALVREAILQYLEDNEIWICSNRPGRNSRQQVARAIEKRTGLTVEISDIAERQLRKLDRPVQEWISEVGLNDRIEDAKTPGILENR